MKKPLPLQARILINTLILLLLFLPAALREGRILGISATEAQEALHSGPPDTSELKAAGYPDALLRKIGRGCWHILSPAGKRIGTAISTAAHDRTAGYAGPIPMRVFLDADGIIRRVRILPNEETPSFMRQITSGRFLDSWIGKPAAPRQPDVVSGASMSARAINFGLNKSLSAYLGMRNTQIASGAGPTETAKTIAVLAVALFALLMSLYPRRHHRLRPVALLLNTGIIGFWAGQFLSLSGLFGWLKQGDAPLIGLVFLVGAGILIPLLKRGNFFCTWICPYGALQELAGRIPVRKITLPGPVLKHAGRLRDTKLASLILLLWTGAGSAILQYEPFSAFLFRHAALPVLLLAGLFILLSLFLHRPWCRFFCPTGAVLHRLSGNQRL